MTRHFQHSGARAGWRAARRGFAPAMAARRGIYSGMAAMAALSLAACDIDLSGLDGVHRTVRGSGQLTEDVRTVRNVDGLLLNAPGTVYATIGDDESLVIEAESNLHRHLRVWAEGGRLRIEVDSGLRLEPTLPIRYHLTVRELSRLTAGGEGRIEVAGLRGRQLFVSSVGSGGIRLDDVVADGLSISVHGSGGVLASGRVGVLEASLGASGPLDARHLDSDEAAVTVAGSGTATVRVRRRLDANLSGSGSVLYYGSPVVWQSVSGSGEVRRVGN